jgi:hypothetical protein
MIKVKDYKQDSPEWVIAKFFDCWKRRAWKQITDYVQLSWLSVYSEPKKRLKSCFSRKLIDANLIQVNARSGVVTDILVEFDISQKLVSEIRLICEKAPMRTSAKGKWGVNPASVFLFAKPTPRVKNKE